MKALYRKRNMGKLIDAHEDWSLEGRVSISEFDVT